MTNLGGFCALQYLAVHSDIVCDECGRHDKLAVVMRAHEALRAALSITPKIGV